MPRGIPYKGTAEEILEQKQKASRAATKAWRANLTKEKKVEILKASADQRKEKYNNDDDYKNKVLSRQHVENLTEEQAEKRRERTRVNNMDENNYKKKMIHSWTRQKKHRPPPLVATEEELDEIWEQYYNSPCCEECGEDYGKYGDGSGRFKCMSHDHKTGKFESVRCNKCNNNAR